MRSRLGIAAAALTGLVAGFGSTSYAGGTMHRCVRLTCECGTINTRVVPFHARKIRCRGCRQMTSLKFAES